MKIYIVRHGETDANKASLFQGCTDYPLNDFGRELAIATGQGLKGIKFDVCYSSSLSRAKETADIILDNSDNKNCEIIIDDRIKEINGGVYEMKPLKNLKSISEKITMLTFLYKPDIMKPFKNGENVRMLKQRTQQFINEISKLKYENILVSTHGCALRAMLNNLYDNPRDFWQGHPPFNCAVSIVDVSKDGTKLIEKDKVFYDDKYCIDHFSIK